MNKDSIISFLKKYPMSILLAIIAIQLVNISQKLDQSGKLAGDERACTRFYAYFDEKIDVEIEKRKAAAKIGVPVGLLRAYCRRLN